MTKRNAHTPSEQRIDDAIASEDILGKDVIDPDGTFIGVTDKLLIDPKSLDIIGISVDKGFLKKGLIIGTDFIREVTPHAVLLSTRPAYQVKGMHVFCRDGTRVGTVDRVSLDQDGNISSLLVKTSMWGGSRAVPATVIDRIERNVLLSVPVSELKEIITKSQG